MAPEVFPGESIRRCSIPSRLKPGRRRLWIAATASRWMSGAMDQPSQPDADQKHQDDQPAYAEAQESAPGV